ncbi:MAG: hypothetical protein ACT4OM_07450 [Actinomycetota bacterium]
MSGLPGGVIVAVAVLQVLVAIVLVVLMVKMGKAIRAQGRPIVPPELKARLRRLFGGGR